MTYRTVTVLVAIAFVVTAAYDIWWVALGNFGRDSYMPGIYPVICLLIMGGARFAKSIGF